MTFTAAGRRAVPSGLPAMVLAACIGLIVIYAYAPEGPPPVRSSVVAAVDLTDNDGDDALFDDLILPKLAPGNPQPKCIQVTYTGDPNTGTIYVAATGVSGALAPHLLVKVERGAAGTDDDCSDFGGGPVTVFNGTLGGLVDTDPAVAETTTGWAPAGTESRTFRITVEVSDHDALQGETAAGTFQWMLVPDAASPSPSPTTPGPATPTPTTPGPTTPAPTTPAPTTAAPTTPAPTTPGPASSTPGPVPTTPAAVPTTPAAVPTTAAPPAESPAAVPPQEPPADSSPEPAGPSALPAVPASPGTAADPSPSGASASPTSRLRVEPPPGEPATPPAGGLAKARAKVAAMGKAVAKAGKAVAEAVTKATEVAAELAARTAQDGALPVSGIGVLLAFLALQNQIDRRDPKLSLAPVSEEYLQFQEPPDDSGLTGPDLGTTRPEGKAS